MTRWIGTAVSVAGMGVALYGVWLYQPATAYILGGLVLAAKGYFLTHPGGGR